MNMHYTAVYVLETHICTLTYIIRTYIVATIYNSSGRTYTWTELALNSALNVESLFINSYSARVK